MPIASSFQGGQVMNCQVCGTENPEDYNFCQECGQKLIKSHFCPTCGYKNQLEAKFCIDCGCSFNPVPVKDQEPAFQAPIPAPQSVNPQATYSPQAISPQPSVVYVRDEQPRQSFNLFRFLWRFASSAVLGYLMSELGKFFIYG